MLKNSVLGALILVSFSAFSATVYSEFTDTETDIYGYPCHCVFDSFGVLPPFNKPPNESCRDHLLREGWIDAQCNEQDGECSCSVKSEKFEAKTPGGSCPSHGEETSYFNGLNGVLWECADRTDFTEEEEQERWEEATEYCHCVSDAPTRSTLRTLDPVDFETQYGPLSNAACESEAWDVANDPDQVELRGYMKIPTCTAYDHGLFYKCYCTYQAIKDEPAFDHPNYASVCDAYETQEELWTWSCTPWSLGFIPDDSEDEANGQDAMGAGYLE